MRLPRGRWLGAVIVTLVVAGASQVASAAWIHAKAIVAQHLIASAWTQARDGGASRRPWPWADMRPIARLQVRSRGVDLYVLDVASARSLAFGPAHVGGTAAPGSAGNAVIVAHRDTHFAFLRDLLPDDEITVEGTGGAISRYRVREIAVVDKGASRLLDAADSPQLTLITCYPFDAVQPGTPMRYVVIAERVA